MRTRSRPHDPVCPLCRDPLARGTAQTCSSCGTAQHAECARELNVACGTLGCAHAGPRQPERTSRLAGAIELPAAVNGAHHVLSLLLGLTLLGAPLALTVLGVLELSRDLGSGAGMLAAGLALAFALMRQLGSGLPLVRVELGERSARLSTGRGDWVLRYRVGRRAAAGARGWLQAPWGMSRAQRRPVYYLRPGGWFARRFVVDDPERGHALLAELRAWGAADAKGSPEKG